MTIGETFGSLKLTAFEWWIFFNFDLEINKWLFPSIKITVMALSCMVDARSAWMTSLMLICNKHITPPSTVIIYESN
jgi:hypothetical protein